MIKNLIELFLINEKFLDFKIKIINEISISKIFNNDTFGPKMMVTGITENKIKK